MQMAWSASSRYGRAAVGLGVDDGDLDAEVAARPDDPQGDLPAVGDEDL